MAVAQPSQHPRWYLIPVRVLLATFLLTLLTFAISLLLGIVGIVIRARIQGTHPNMTLAYGHIALPVALVAAVVSLVVLAIAEIRNYRQERALAQIARASR